MKKHFSVALILLASLGLSGCETMSDTQQRTAVGAGVGAVAGAILSSATGGRAGVGAVAGAAVGGVGTYLWSSNMERQRKEMEAATQGTGVSVVKTPDNQLRLDIPSDISFDTGRYDIAHNFKAILDTFADGLRRNTATTVRIVGHTDSTGSDAINNPLSLNRANSVSYYLQDRGVNGSRIRTEGRGAMQPVADNGSSYGRAKNRRVEIYVSEQSR